ncbi:MAG: hypothetical protein U0350_49600 [Caldilineaceae bacterium]
MTEQTTQEAVAEIWRLFRETDAKFKETDAKFKETDAKFKETDIKFKETAAEIQATNASLRRLEGLFGSQWGRLMEALVQPGLLTLFQARGHQVRRLHQRSKAQRNGDTMEIDAILEDGAEVIVGEVKSSVGIEEVNTFLTDLAEFTSFFPLYRGYQVYGAIAGLEISVEVARYAYRKGLFVLTVGREGLVTILNDGKFHPHNFGGDI